jgi:phosphopantetheinyl transferase (holo-ACP synthase)
MHYIGNDIVAYKHIRCLEKWKDHHFLNKILLADEQKQLQFQKNKDAYLWKLWTLKEAAYKLSCFLGNRSKFHALDFTVECNYLIKDADIHIVNEYPFYIENKIPQISSKVYFQDHIFIGNSFITHQFVHSAVTNMLNENTVYNAIAQHSNYNKNDFSNEVRLFTIAELAKQNIFTQEIKKTIDGIPFIEHNGKQSFISLSHDQQFVSFAYVL